MTNYEFKNSDYPHATALPKSKMHIESYGPIGMGIPKKSSKNKKMTTKKVSAYKPKRSNGSKKMMKKLRKQRRSKKINHHQKEKYHKQRKQMHHKSMFQLCLLIINAYNMASMSQIHRMFKKLNITRVSFSNVKRSIKKMIKLKVVRCVSNKVRGSNKKLVTKFESTGKILPKKFMCKRKSTTARIIRKDQKLRSKMIKLAHKAARNGRTYEQVVFDYLKENPMMMFNSISFYLKENNMKCSNFILIKVLERLRKKGVVVIEDGKWNSLTGKKIPLAQPIPEGFKR